MKCKINLSVLIFFFLGLLEWILGLFIYDNVALINKQVVLVVLEWILVITAIGSVWSWKKQNGKFFTPYTIFYFFLLIFNAGQFLFWAFGIHYITPSSKELGVATHIRYMDIDTLIKIMVITIPALTFFHAGALLFGKKSTKSRRKKIVSKQDIYISFKWVGLVILILTYVVAMLDAISNYDIYKMTGYTSIYYGETQEINPLLKYISYMFLPSIFMVYIGFKCSRRAFIWLTILFLPYMFVNMLMGDRGSWIYFICIWAWCFFNFYDESNEYRINKGKTKKRGKIITLGIIAIAVLSATTVYVKYREIGIDAIQAEDVRTILGDFKYVFIKPFFEMGQSARVLGIIIQDKLYEAWEYGNTYVAGLLAMPLPRIKLWFGFQNELLDDWFSQTYMGISNYGLGFSIIAEAFLNGGLLFYPFYMTIIGGVIGKLCSFENSNKEDPNHLFFMLSSMVMLLTICRSSVELSLRKWFYGCVVLYIVVILVGKFIASRRK